MAITRADFPLPDLDEPLVAPFFAAAARGELMIPRCEPCGKFVWYPAAVCPNCDAATPVWTAVSGRATLFSWAVVHRPFLPAFVEMVPFVTALVALVEDPAVRLPTYLVDVEPSGVTSPPNRWSGDASELRADQPVAVTFRSLTFPTVPDRAVTVPMFRLAS